MTVRIPLHLDPSDSRAEANLVRINHYQRMYALTGGKGFRQPSKRGGAPTRIERLGHASFAS